MNKRIQGILQMFILVFLMHRCGVGPVTDSGGASETIAVIVTDSGVIGNVFAKKESGDSAMQGVTVKLFDKNYLPFYPNSNFNFYASAISDEFGDFSFSIIKQGLYKIYAQNTLAGRSAFIDSIIIRDSIIDTVYDSLVDPGNVSGQVYSVLSNNDTIAAPYYHVFILGTPFRSRTGATGAFLLNSIPEGYYTLLSAPDSIFSTIDSLNNMTALQYISIINENNTIDTVKPGKTLTGKEIFLKR